MAHLNLVNKKEEIIFGNDSVVIAKYGYSLTGGRVLDTAGFPADVIHAGHIIIRDAEGHYKPMPINEDGEAYASLPSSHTYAGVLYRSILTAKPAASVLVAGVVNEKALPFPITSVRSAFSNAVPQILFTEDEPVDVKAGENI